jgi:hypothetical protein
MACAWVRFKRALHVLLWVFMLTMTAQAETVVDVQNLKVARGGDGLYMTADWRFELPAPLEDALLKGVPLYFVTEAELTQERWYFYDKRLALAERHVRVIYQPLTRRWRVSVSPEAFIGVGLGMNLGQSYSTMEEAMQLVKRVTQWRIANAADLNPELKQTLAIRFKLDLSQLPRPLQIGALTQTEWNISYSKTQRLALEAER